VALFVFAVIYPTPGVAGALAFIAGVGDATAQSGIWPLAGGIHPRCSAAAAFGCAIAGLGAGLLRMLTKAVFGEETPEQERLGSAVYFGISVVVIAGVCLAHYAIKKYKRELTVAFFNAGHAESTDSFVLRSVAIKRSLMQVNRSIMMEEEGRAAQAVEGGDECPNEEEKEEDHGNNNPVEGENFQDNNPGEGESFRFDNDEQENKGGSSSKGHIFSLCMEGTEVYREAFRCAWIPIMSQFVNFFITLSLFPGVGKYNGGGRGNNLLHKNVSP